MTINYHKKTLELTKTLRQTDKRCHGIPKNNAWLRENALTQHHNIDYDVYTIQSLFSIILINYAQNEKSSYTYLDFETDLSFDDVLPLLPYSRVHKHNYFELLFVLHGQIDVFIEGEHYRYNRGDACLINRNIRHSEDFHGNFSAIYFNITEDYLHFWPQEDFFHIKKGKIGWFFQENLRKGKENMSNYINFSPIVTPTSNTSTNMEKIIYIIIKEMIERSTGYKTIIQGLIIRFFSQLQAPAKYAHSYIQLDSVTGDNLFEKTLQYINDKKGKVTRNELAKALHYNGNYINQNFLNHTNQSISEYSRNVIFREAANLLLNSDISITKIIKQLGYENRTSFYNQFKKRYGVTPLQYRDGSYSSNED